MTAPHQQKPSQNSAPPSRGGTEHPRQTNGSSQKVLDYLRKNPNVQVSYNEIAEQTGTRYEVMSNYIQHLINVGVDISKPARGIVIYHSGQVAVLARTEPRPEPEPEPGTYIPSAPLYEFIGNSSGMALARDENMEVYVLVSLKEWMTRQ